MDLADIRTRIDAVDAQILDLLGQRMQLAREVAESKRGSGKAVFDPARERQKLRAVHDGAPEGLGTQATTLFSLLMSMSRAEQLHILGGDRQDLLSDRIRAALVPVDEPFPQVADVACQGVEGAYSQIAACKLFRLPSISYFGTFEGVCRAVRDGFCRYGVLPIENSTAGSVNAVYDLLAEHDFFIVRSLRLKIDHNLLAKPGTRIGDIREVTSHEQAVAQCQGFLGSLGARVTVCENTAKAAERVAVSDRGDLAALSSIDCADLYGLDVLERDVQDSDNNYTRFVVISASPQIFPGATRTSLMLTTKHEPGALYRVLERIYSLGVNIIKLESRPIAGRDFEFMFYFDLDCPVAGSELVELLDALDDVCDTYRYFGSYTELV